jgi:predicted DCC family thiol-disulfide oxidoreductase YuxK
MHTDPYELEVFYDGACPICVREMRMVSRWDRSGRVRFTDIAAPEFDADAYGRTGDDFMKRMQARLPDGTWVEGVESFRRLGALLGFPRLAALSRAPGLSQLLGVAYDLFARNRLRLTGRCDSAVCDIRRPKAAAP